VSGAHDHGHGPAGSRLGLAFLLTLAILGIELAAGLASQSLALLSDAGHILTDAIALGLAWLAVAQARRPADNRRTYGYQRVGILTALLNGATLLAIVAAIAYEAVRRLQHPQPVRGGIVIAAAALAIAVNAFIGLSLRGAGDDLNVRAALLHVVGDLAASAGVMVAGAVVLLTGWLPADPLLSLAIAALIALGAWRIVHRTVHILLEGTPAGLDLAAVRREIEAHEGVTSVHDLHVWALSSEAVVLSCHLVVADERMADAEHRMRGLKRRLSRRFAIEHTTIQLESCHPCPGDCLEPATISPVTGQ
jgi:cobalt-zinc-cadmium efflux system protein